MTDAQWNAADAEANLVADGDRADALSRHGLRRRRHAVGVGRGIAPRAGNLFIGIAEGAILVWLCRPKRAGSIPIMIAANYFSAWVGGLGLLPKITAHLNLDLYNAWRWLWCMVVVSYLLTLLLEWPFVALSLRQSEGWFRKSLWGSLVVQSASYLVLFGWYWAASGTSLYTDLAVVPPSAISLPQGVTLYYVADNDTAVYAQDLDHFKTVKIGEVNPSGNWDRLFLLESSTIAGRWDLVVGLDPVASRGPKSFRQHSFRRLDLCCCRAANRRISARR